jgi:hypothetical protein
LVRAVDGRGSSLVYLPLDRVRHLLGCEPYFGQCETTGIVAASGVAQLESSRLVKPRVVFLGSSIPENTTAHEVNDMIERNATGKYTSYFSLDIAGQASPEDVDVLLQASTGKEETLQFVEARAALNTFSAFDAGLFAQARSIVDWNFRNQVRNTYERPHNKTIYLSVDWLSFVPHVVSPVIPSGPAGSWPARQLYPGERATALLIYVPHRKVSL